MTEWHEGMKSVRAEQPAMGYPVVSIAGEPIMFGSPSLIAHASDSMQCISSASLKRLYASGTVSAKRLEPWFDYLPRSPAVKPTQRPVISCSRKNVDTIDKQEERDRQKFSAKAYKYRSHLPDAYHHHHKPILNGGCPEDHVGPMGDKGRHKPDWCKSASIFDPITATSRPTGSPARVEMRPHSAPPQNPCSSISAAAGEPARLRPGTGRVLQGRYNPLTHTWLEQPDSAAQAARQRESDRVHGASVGAEFGIRSPTKRAAAVKPPWAGCYDTDGPQLAADNDSSSRGAGDAAAANSSSTNAKDCSSAHAGSLRGKSSYHGDTWGTYDVLRHEWKVPPRDSRCIKAEAAPNGIHFDRPGTSHSRRVPLPANQGVYDPIKGEWKQPPGNVRVMAGCEFSPKRMFEQQAFVTR